MTTMPNQPQPGDIWERDGERRDVVRTNSGIVTYRGSNGITWDWFDGWLVWQSGATLVEGGEGDETKPT